MAAYHDVASNNSDHRYNFADVKMKSIGQMLDALALLYDDEELDPLEERFLCPCITEYRKTKTTTGLSGEAVERIERMYRLHTN